MIYICLMCLHLVYYPITSDRFLKDSDKKALALLGLGFVFVPTLVLSKFLSICALFLVELY